MCRTTPTTSPGSRACLHRAGDALLGVQVAQVGQVEVASEAAVGDALTGGAGVVLTRAVHLSLARGAPVQYVVQLRLMDDLRSALKDLGLTGHEPAVYAALLEQSP